MLDLILGLLRTIGSVLSFLFYRADKAKDAPHIKVTPEFQYGYGELLPKIDLQVRIANQGQRLVVTEKVELVLEPANDPYLPWLQGGVIERINISRHPVHHELAEEKSFTLLLTDKDIPLDRRIYEISQIVVTDTLGRQWKSPKRFGQRVARATMKLEGRRDLRFGNSGNERGVELLSYRFDRQWTIQIYLWNAGLTIKRGLIVPSRFARWRQLRRLSNEAEKFTKGESDSLMNKLQRLRWLPTD